MLNKFKIRLKNNITYYLTIGISLLIFIWGIFFTDNFKNFFDSAYAFTTNNFSWYFMILMAFFFLFSIYLLFSKYKNVKLGDNDSKPEFSNISWFAMLFSAGIGIGLVFWGLAEPLTHYLNPLGMEGGTKEAIGFAYRKSWLHWGVSAWACYALLALVIGYMHFRKKKPILLSSVLIPIIGEKNAKGLIGKIIDILTIFVTIAGILTSLGMGTLQINSGLNYLFNVPETKFIQVIIITLITILFLISATTGVKKGIKILSNLNLGVAVIFFLGAFVIVPKIDLLNNTIMGLGQYAQALVIDKFSIFAKGDWYSKWTIFYWAWWIAWAPFVSIFIARVSKGRTIGEFIKGVLLVPAGFCMMWFSVFGTLGMTVPIDVAKEAVLKVETALFVVLNEYSTIGLVLSIIAVVLLFTFFVTSADSATYVLSVIASDGKLNPKNSRKIIIGVIQSLLTIAFLFAGGFEMIQTATIVMALPFGIIIFLSVMAFIKEIRTENIEEVNRVANKENINKNKGHEKGINLKSPKEIGEGVMSKRAIRHKN